MLYFAGLEAGLHLNAQDVVAGQTQVVVGGVGCCPSPTVQH